MKIMIVDDEEDLRETLREFFQDEGYLVSTASNGAEALELLEHDDELPSLVILDLSMPIVSGGEVYAEMRKTPRLAQIPVIIATSDPLRAPRGVPVMKKPLDLRRLIAAVQQTG